MIKKTEILTYKTTDVINSNITKMSEFFEYDYSEYPIIDIVFDSGSLFENADFNFDIKILNDEYDIKFNLDYNILKDDDVAYSGSILTDVDYEVSSSFVWNHNISANSYVQLICSYTEYPDVIKVSDVIKVNPGVNYKFINEPKVLYRNSNINLYWRTSDIITIILINDIGDETKVFKSDQPTNNCRFTVPDMYDLNVKIKIFNTKYKILYYVTDFIPLKDLVVNIDKSVFSDGIIEEHNVPIKWDHSEISNVIIEIDENFGYWKLIDDNVIREDNGLVRRDSPDTPFVFKSPYNWRIPLNTNIDSVIIRISLIDYNNIFDMSPVFKINEKKSIRLINPSIKHIYVSSSNIPILYECTGIDKVYIDYDVRHINTDEKWTYYGTHSISDYNPYNIYNVHVDTSLIPKETVSEHFRLRLRDEKNEYISSSSIEHRLIKSWYNDYNSDSGSILLTITSDDTPIESTWKLYSDNIEITSSNDLYHEIRNLENKEYTITFSPVDTYEIDPYVVYIENNENIAKCTYIKHTGSLDINYHGCFTFGYKPDKINYIITNLNTNITQSSEFKLDYSSESTFSNTIPLKVGSYNVSLLNSGIINIDDSELEFRFKPYMYNNIINNIHKDTRTSINVAFNLIHWKLYIKLNLSIFFTIQKGHYEITYDTGYYKFVMDSIFYVPMDKALLDLNGIFFQIKYGNGDNIFDNWEDSPVETKHFSNKEIHPIPTGSNKFIILKKYTLKINNVDTVFDLNRYKGDSMEKNPNTSSNKYFIYTYKDDDANSHDLSIYYRHINIS